ncbi:MAG TPA: Ku protein [Longimicrobiaceae bacterium]|nr:Ku protein [Longimicrobiaceae bacterium]
MARAIWKGSISFGLVNIPVGLFSAEKPDELSFRQLDKRNMSPVGYKKYNKSTGEEVELEDIVKGYEYDDEQYVVLSDEDLRRANPEKTQTVEITDFVELDEIEPTFYDKPYYLAPLKKNAKAYALLREALRRSKRVGIAKVVIRSREYLSAVVPQGPVLVLEILRYPNEIRPIDDLELPGDDLDKLGVADRELDMAERLIEGMSAEWEPEKYKDEYRDDLMSLIHRRIESGQTEVVDETPVEEVEPRGDVVDIMALLKQSVEATSRERGRVAADTEARPKKKASPTASKSGAKEKEKEKEKPAPRARTRSKSKAD